MKRDKKELDKKIEDQMDREFKKLGIHTPRVYYFRDVPPFNAVTIVTEMPFHWKDLASILSEYPQGALLYNPATYLLQRLAEVHDLHGVAICDPRDPFSRREGRRRAKHRLLRYRKGRKSTRNG